MGELRFADLAPHLASFTNLTRLALMGCLIDPRVSVDAPAPTFTLRLAIMVLGPVVPGSECLPGGMSVADWFFGSSRDSLRTLIITASDTDTLDSGPGPGRQLGMLPLFNDNSVKDHVLAHGLARFRCLVAVLVFTTDLKSVTDLVALADDTNKQLGRTLIWVQTKGPKKADEV